MIAYRAPMKSVGKNAMRNASGQFAPGAVYMDATQRIGTLLVTRTKMVISDGPAPTSLTSPVASRTKTVGFFTSAIYSSYASLEYKINERDTSRSLAR